MGVLIHCASPRSRTIPVQLLDRRPNRNRGVGEWGNHRIQVRIDDMASREMELTVKEGETVDLGCRARPGAAFFNPLLIGKPIRLFLRRAG